METNEIMVNEEVIETTEVIVGAGSGKGFKVSAGIGLAVIGGVVTYKYLVKPLMAKIKAKKEQEAIDVDFENFDDTDECEEPEETN